MLEENSRFDCLINHHPLPNYLVGYYPLVYEYLCDPDDMHFFSKMLEDLEDREVIIRKISPGDIFALTNEIIRWKIVKDRKGQLYLGYITLKTSESYANFYGWESAYAIYILLENSDSNKDPNKDQNKDQKKPRYALHRLRTNNINSIHSLLK